MPVPNLLHPVNITVQRIDNAQTFVDDDFREPIQQAARLSNFVIKGQVEWMFDKSLESGRGGATEYSDGYVLFRYRDLNGIGQTIDRGDRFIKLGTIDVDVYVVKLRPMGHWPDQGGPTILRAYFRDRQPSRQNRGAL